MVNPAGSTTFTEDKLTYNYSYSDGWGCVGPVTFQDTYKIHGDGSSEHIYKYTALRTITSGAVTDTDNYYEQSDAQHAYSYDDNGGYVQHLKPPSVTGNDAYTVWVTNSYSHGIQDSGTAVLNDSSTGSSGTETYACNESDSNSSKYSESGSSNVARGYGTTNQSTSTWYGVYDQTTGNTSSWNDSGSENLVSPSSIPGTNNVTTDTFAAGDSSASGYIVHAEGNDTYTISVSGGGKRSKTSSDSGTNTFTQAVQLDSQPGILTGTENFSNSSNYGLGYSQLYSATFAPGQYTLNELQLNETLTNGGQLNDQGAGTAVTAGNGMLGTTGTLVNGTDKFLTTRSNSETLNVNLLADGAGSSETVQGSGNDSSSSSNTGHEDFWDAGTNISWSDILSASPGGMAGLGSFVALNLTGTGITETSSGSDDFTSSRGQTGDYTLNAAYSLPATGQPPASGQTWNLGNFNLKIDSTSTNSQSDKGNAAIGLTGTSSSDLVNEDFNDTSNTPEQITYVYTGTGSGYTLTIDDNSNFSSNNSQDGTDNFSHQGNNLVSLANPTDPTTPAASSGLLSANPGTETDTGTSNFGESDGNLGGEVLHKVLTWSNGAWSVSNLQLSAGVTDTFLVGDTGTDNITLAKSSDTQSDQFAASNNGSDSTGIMVQGGGNSFTVTDTLGLYDGGTVNAGGKVSFDDPIDPKAPGALAMLVTPGQDATASGAAGAATGAVTSEEESGSGNLTKSDYGYANFNVTQVFAVNNGNWTLQNLQGGLSLWDNFNWNQGGNLTLQIKGNDTQTDTGAYTAGDGGTIYSNIGITGSGTTFAVVDNEGLTDNYNASVKDNVTFDDKIDPNAAALGNAADNTTPGQSPGSSAAAAASGIYQTEEDQGSAKANASDNGGENITSTAIYLVTNGTSTLQNLSANAQANDTYNSGDSGSDTLTEKGAAASDTKTGDFTDGSSGTDNPTITVSGSGTNFTVTETDKGNDNFNTGRDGTDNFDQTTTPTTPGAGVGAGAHNVPGFAAAGNSAAQGATGALQSEHDFGKGTFNIGDSGGDTVNLNETVNVTGNTSTVASLNLVVTGNDTYTKSDSGNEEVDDSGTGLTDKRTGTYGDGSGGGGNGTLTITGSDSAGYTVTVNSTQTDGYNWSQGGGETFDYKPAAGTPSVGNTPNAVAPGQPSGGSGSGRVAGTGTSSGGSMQDDNGTGQYSAGDNGNDKIIVVETMGIDSAGKVSLTNLILNVTAGDTYNSQDSGNNEIVSSDGGMYDDWKANYTDGDVGSNSQTLIVTGDSNSLTSTLIVTGKDNYTWSDGGSDTYSYKGAVKNPNAFGPQMTPMTGTGQVALAAAQIAPGATEIDSSFGTLSESDTGNQNQTLNQVATIQNPLSSSSSPPTSSLTSLTLTMGGSDNYTENDSGIAQIQIVGQGVWYSEGDNYSDQDHSTTQGQTTITGSGTDLTRVDNGTVTDQYTSGIGGQYTYDQGASADSTPPGSVPVAPSSSEQNFYGYGNVNWTDRGGDNLTYQATYAYDPAPAKGSAVAADPMWVLGAFWTIYKSNETAKSSDSGGDNATGPLASTGGYADSDTQTDLYSEQIVGNGNTYTDSFTDTMTDDFQHSVSKSANQFSTNSTSQGNATYTLTQLLSTTPAGTSLVSAVFNGWGQFGANGDWSTFDISATNANGTVDTVVTQTDTHLFDGGYQVPITYQGDWLSVVATGIGSMINQPAAVANGGPADASGGSSSTAVGPFPAGITRSQISNAAGQVLSRSVTDDATGQVLFSESYTYDSSGKVLTHTDSAGRTTAWTYDANGKVTSETTAYGTPQAATTLYTYDQNKDLTSVTDPDGNVTRYTYNAQGQETSMTDPLGHTEYMTYNDQGQLASVTNRNGLTRTMSYNAAGQVVSETWYAADGTSVVDQLNFTYDSNGLLLTAGNNEGTYTFSYDDQGRVIGVTEPFGVSSSFAYDANGNRILVQDSFGGTTQSTYDAANQLVSELFTATGQPTLRIDQTYDASGQVASQTRYSDAAGTQVVATSDYSYDYSGNVTTITHRNASGQVLAQYVYVHDAAGDVVSETDNGVTTSYGYDSTGQLTSYGNQTNTYDPNGNRTNPGYVIGPDNQVLSDGTYNYAYDNEGNEVSKTNVATGETWVYAYDNINELSSATETTSTGTAEIQVTLKYDVFGNRLEKDVYTPGNGTALTRYAYDGWNPKTPAPQGNEKWNTWATLDDNNNLVTRFFRGDAVDQVFAEIGAGGNASWYLTDRLGSTRALVDNGGNVFDQIAYDAFGNITNQTNPSAQPQFLYTGRPFDKETGLQQDRDRYYDPATGRWMSQDPIQFAAGDSNLYRYVHNQPTNATDPSGRDWVWPWDPNAQWGFGSAVAGIGEALSNGWSEVKLVGGFIFTHPFEAAQAAWSARWESLDSAAGLLYRMGSHLVSVVTFGQLQIMPPEMLDAPFGNQQAFLNGFHVIGGGWQIATDIVLLVGGIRALAAGAMGLFVGGGGGALGPELALLPGLVIDVAAAGRAGIGLWIGIGVFRADFPRDPNAGNAGGQGNPAAAELRALNQAEKDALRAQARDIWQARTGRRAIWDGMDVHHRIPLEWSHLFPNSNPNALSNLIGMTPENHTLVTNAWNAWRQGLNGRIPTQAEILEQARRIEELFGNLMTFLQ